MRATPATAQAARRTTEFYIVSPAFEGKSRVERHRMINTALASELAGSVHALAIHAQAPQETSKQASKEK